MSKTSENLVENDFITNEREAFRVKIEVKNEGLSNTEARRILAILDICYERVIELEYNLTEQINEALIESDPEYMQIYPEEELYDLEWEVSEDDDKDKNEV